MKTLHKTRGNALVEFAIVIPILILLLLGTTIIGLAINAKIVVSGAAREAGRTYSIGRNPDASRDRALDAIIGGGLPLRKGGLTLFDPDRDVRLTTRGDYVYVTVTYRQPLYVQKMVEVAGTTVSYLTLRSESVFRVER
jgi:hypothetical protein